MGGKRMIARYLPLIDEFKLNVDCAARRKLGIAGIGGILRDEPISILGTY